MSSIIMKMLDDIKAGSPVGIVKKVAVTPRDQLMYGRKDGVTMSQHLDEFNNYRDDQGRSFDQIILDDLFIEPELMLLPPKPQVSKTFTKHFRATAKIESASETMAKNKEFWKEFHDVNHRRIKQRMAVVPKDPVPSGSLKRKADSNASEIPAPSAMVQYTTTNSEDNCRKRPRVKAYFKK